ncbi:hypothetical protein CLAFUW4_01932 [Fulvia fulva]|uniref:Putative effector 39 n=1 Tax=Passalora fulva TaxID=5499 RepID=A0A1P8YXK4_PASFU|nr:uncharacterized protein CLAFUR5_01926 [Fulvia fulva]AQA29242.1 putative effector 39 [Fulvia fulva]KAK4636251.1 hypothetical protein CLAFUR4_01927 [Fulvia fulva]KAK4637741.1 hypothetical protein CLAFUR0_01929 [Fulvia fulva]UJO12395.1 hypothetical protein CLAFUR5_01926 [Fulvia fulva]WPV09513.1 hypothetical protein CLAFUW4_01932 [Fulvia fulva]
MKTFFVTITLIASAAATALMTPKLVGLSGYQEMRLEKRTDIAACIACGLSFCIPSPACDVCPCCSGDKCTNEGSKHEGAAGLD